MSFVIVCDMGFPVETLIKMGNVCVQILKYDIAVQEEVKVSAAFIYFIIISCVLMYFNISRNTNKT